MNIKGLEIKKMTGRIAKRKASVEKKLFIINLTKEKFCEILNNLAPMFRFELINICEDFDGYWEKKILDGKTVWRKDSGFAFMRI